ncbi:MAG: DUF697 domain-containing protein [Myxococcota bacterium]
MAQQELERAKAVIDKHIIAAVAVGVQPLPGADLVLLTGTQLNMLRRLAQIYGVEFRPELGRSLLAAFLGSVAPLASASLVKMIPVVGWLVGGLGGLAFAGASTYAVGRVFVQHFESGGTFLTLEPDKVMDYYQEQFDGYRSRPEPPQQEQSEYYGIKP